MTTADTEMTSRVRLQRRSEIKKRGIHGCAVCQCRPAVAQEATEGRDKERRSEAREERRVAVAEERAREESETRERGPVKMN